MYNPFQREITAFVLTIELAKVLDVFSVLSLETIHQCFTQTDGTQRMGKI